MSNLSNRKGLWLMAGVVVVVAAILYFSGTIPPANEDLSGTIGGVKKAEKYNAPQIGDKDVVLGDTEITNLLQNDQIQNLLHDGAFRAAMSSDAFRAAMSNDAFRAAMSNDAFRAAMSSDAFRAAMSNEALRIAQ